MSRTMADSWGWSVLRSAILFCTLADSAWAQPKAGIHTQGVVDIAQLKSGRSLRGAIAWRDPNGTMTMAVSKEWLRTSNPNLFREALDENLNQRMAAWTNARRRIEEWEKTVQAAPQLSFFLKQEKERLSQLIANPAPDEPGFLWFDVVENKVAKLQRATAEQARIALLAWNEALPQVETRDEKTLTKELKGKGVDLQGPVPELLDWLPPRQQNDTEWAARRALVEYTLVKQMDFQGTAGAFIRTGEGKTLNLAEILPQILQSQLGSILKDLNLDGAAPKTPDMRQSLKSLIQQAESAKVTGFRVTQVTVDPTSLRATVESRFVAQLSPGDWKTIWSLSVTEDGSKPRPQVEARIEQDPQVKSALDTAKSLGISNPGAVQQAIRFGAATMAAQAAIDAAFGQFRDRYSHRLEGPPLRLNLTD